MMVVEGKRAGRLIEVVARALADAGVSQGTVLVAASGGIDSTVMLYALAEARAASRIGLAVGHVHHGMRGEAADRDAESVRVQAETLGLRFLMERVEPGSLRLGRSNRERPTWQEAARRVRYEALGRMAEAAGASPIATAHTLDDQAETVLMRLLRGTGPDGLGGIAERSPDGRMIRPVLSVSRAEIEAFAASRGLVWREDASNRCDRYTRNRLRHDWLPGLARDFNPQLLRAIARLAEAQRRDAEWIEDIVDEATDAVVYRDDDGALRLRDDGWVDLPEALARRVVRRLLVRAGAGRDVTSTHIRRAIEFLRAGVRDDGPRTLELPGGLRIHTTRDGFEVVRVDGESERKKD